MADRPLKVAWISSFPIEWLPGVPPPVAALPRSHPAPWRRVLLGELKGEKSLELHVFAARKEFDRHRTFQLDGVTFHCLKLPPGVRTLSLFWWETLLIQRALKRIGPDVVQAWGSERGAALVATRLGYPYFVSMQGLLEWCLPHKTRIGFRGMARLEARLERASLSRAAVATAESTFSVNWLRQHYPHLEVYHVEHSPNWLFYRVERQPQTVPLQFLFNSTVAFQKGADLLFLALNKLRDELDFRLTIIGGKDSSTPRFLPQIQAATSPVLWERITFREGLTQEQVAQELAQTTLLLMPTRADTGPMAVKEAAVAGVPVVGSRVGGIPDYIVPGQNGFLFPPEDLAAFVGAIREACAHPQISRGLVDPATLAKIRDHLSPRHMAEGFLDLYRRLGARK